MDLVKNKHQSQSNKQNRLKQLHYLFGLYFIVSMVISCNNANQNSISETEIIVKDFFDVYKGSGPRNALNQLLQSNVFISKEGIDSVAIKLEGTAKKMGDFQGYEIVSIEKYGKSIEQITCVAKHSKVPVKFVFKFYQPGDKWRIQNFRYEPNFIDDIE